MENRERNDEISLTQFHDTLIARIRRKHREQNLQQKSTSNV